MLADGVPSKLVCVVKSLCGRTKSRVRGSIRTKVRNAKCRFSLVRFKFVVDWVMLRAMGIYRDIQVFSGCIKSLEFAADFVELREDLIIFQTVLQRLKECAPEVVLETNTTKTSMFVTPDSQ